MKNQDDLNQGRIEGDDVYHIGNEIVVLKCVDKQIFIDLCNDSGWTIGFEGDFRGDVLNAYCGEKMSARYSSGPEIICLRIDHITKPSRIREEDVLDIYYDKRSEGDDKGYCAVEVNHKKINFVEFALQQGWAAGLYDCDNSKDELMATRENENSPITFFSR